MFVQLHQTLRCAYRTSEKTLTTNPLLTHPWAAEVSPPTPLRPSPWLWLVPSSPGRPPYQACIHLPRDGKPFQDPKFRQAHGLQQDAEGLAHLLHRSLAPHFKAPASAHDAPLTCWACPGAVAAKSWILLIFVFGIPKRGVRSTRIPVPVPVPHLTDLSAGHARLYREVHLDASVASPGLRLPTCAADRSAPRRIPSMWPSAHQPLFIALLVLLLDYRVPLRAAGFLTWLRGFLAFSAPLVPAYSGPS